MTDKMNVLLERNKIMDKCDNIVEYSKREILQDKIWVCDGYMHFLLKKGAIEKTITCDCKDSPYSKLRRGAPK